MEQLPPVYDEKSCWKKFITFLAIYWRSFIIIIWPVVLTPFLIKYHHYSEARCAFVILLMAVYWVTECLPMPIVALLPVALYPPLNILSTEKTCLCYMNDTMMVFIGGLTLAIAIEHSQLHMRIALGIMNCMGCSHRKLLGGLICVTMFLSMWISNTATTAMMVPIIFAVLSELEKAGLGKVYEVTNDLETKKKVQEPSKVTRGYLMGVAFASNFGGTATLVGTGTNLIFKGIFESKFPNGPSISFAEWMFWSSPQAFLNSFITWLYILIFYFGMFRPKSQDAQLTNIGPEGEAIAKRVMSEKYHDLGKMSFQEKAVSFLFFVVVVLWLTRKPGFTKGWYDFLYPHHTGSAKIQDSMPVILIMILMFIIPKEPSFLYAFSNDANKRPKSASDSLLNWNIIHEKIPWGLMFVVGGGFAIAEGSKVSKLSAFIGDSLSPLKSLPPFTLLCVICGFISCFNELTSNMGVANIILPVIAQMSKSVGLNPMYLMIPSATMCSYSFRLPSSTPPLAIITMISNMPVKYLMIGGCIPAIYSLLMVLVSFPIWGCYVYKIDVNAPIPEWAVGNSSKFTLE